VREARPAGAKTVTPGDPREISAALVDGPEGTAIRALQHPVASVSLDPLLVGASVTEDPLQLVSATAVRHPNEPLW